MHFESFMTIRFVHFSAPLFGAMVVSPGDAARDAVAVLETRSDLQSFAWTKSADADRTLTFAYKDVKSVGTYLSDVAQKSLGQVAPVYEAQCQEKGREAAIDFVSGMAIREMRDAAEYEALQESVGVLVKRGELPAGIDIETVDQVKTRIGKSAPAYRAFESDFAKRKTEKLQILNETRAKQKAQLVKDTVEQCLKPLWVKEDKARAWQDISSVTQMFAFKEPVGVSTKPSRAVIVFIWADGRSVEKVVDADQLYEALTRGSTLTEILQTNESLVRSIVGDE